MVLPGPNRPMRRKWPRRALAVIVLAALVGWWAMGHHRQLPLASLSGSSSDDAETSADPEEMVWIAGGRFMMGSDFSPDPAARPQHPVEVGSFWIDRHEVTNAQFAEFVAATGYRTTAEEHGEGWVFEPLRAAWLLMPGADWRHPQGPHSTIAGLPRRPVVLVSWYDAAAYARAGQANACRRKPNGNWPRAAVGTTPTSLGGGSPKPPRSRWRMPGRDGFPSAIWGSTVVANWPTSRPIRRIASAWSTCLGTFGSGAPIGTPRTIISCARWPIPPGPGIQPAAGRRVLRGGSWLSADNLSPETRGLGSRQRGAGRSPQPHRLSLRAGCPRPVAR